MALNKSVSFFLVLTLIIICGCANIQRPQGGPRDRTPPKLIKSNPPNQTRNFTSKIIQLDFDEYFKLVNEFQEITISPNIDKAPQFSIKSKSLLIRLRDSLAKNTTYVINLGKAIADVNEGNILKNFTYVFSTGPIIDSLNITGNVTNAVTTLKEKDVTVMLFTLKQDSILFGKKKPSIYTTTDTAGNFKLSNLHAGDYKIYALKETSANKIYDQDDELIAFSSNVIHLTKDAEKIHLKLFKQTPAKFKSIERRIDPDGKFFFTFNKGIAEPEVKIFNPQLDAEKIVDFSKLGDTASIYLKTMAFDSVKVSFFEKRKSLDTLTLRRGKKDTYKRTIGLKYNLSPDSKLKPGENLQAIANYPISAIDVSRIILLEDSTDVTENINLQQNLQNPKIFDLKYRWKQGKTYTVTFNAGSFTDLYGDKSSSIFRKFELDKTENYSPLTLHTTLPDTGKNYIVQLLTVDNTILRSDIIKKTGSIIYRSLVVGKYHVRVIYDTNRNGKWDTGNLKSNIQPETIWRLPKEVILRPNWEGNEDINVPMETTP